jgi:hypothetical protein
MIIIITTVSLFQEVLARSADGQPQPPARLQLIASRPAAEAGSVLDGALAAQPYGEHSPCAPIGVFVYSGFWGQMCYWGQLLDESPAFLGPK